MKQHFNLTINKPCQEKFDEFQPTDLGGFCGSCQKEVIDFSKMSETEIIQYFRNSSGNTCGRFQPSQLKTYSEAAPPKRKRSFSLLGTGLLSFSLLSFSFSNTKAQHSRFVTAMHVAPQKTNNKPDAAPNTNDKGYTTIEGVVTDDAGEALPGINVLIKGTETGTSTDVNGKFRLYFPQETDIVLVFSFIGFTSQQVTVSAYSSKLLRIKMKEDSCELTGEVIVNKVYQSKRSFWQRFKDLFE